MQPNIELVPREEPEIRLSINTPIEELLKHKEFEEFFLIELRILMIKLIYPYLTGGWLKGVQDYLTIRNS